MKFNDIQRCLAVLLRSHLQCVSKLSLTSLRKHATCVHIDVSRPRFTLLPGMYPLLQHVSDSFRYQLETLQLRCSSFRIEIALNLASRTSLRTKSLRRVLPPGVYDGPNRHEEMQRANDLVQELNACDAENPMTESALKAIGPARQRFCVKKSLTLVTAVTVAVHSDSLKPGVKLDCPADQGRNFSTLGPHSLAAIRSSSA